MLILVASALCVQINCTTGFMVALLTLFGLISWLEASGKLFAAAGRLSGLPFSPSIFIWMKLPICNEAAYGTAFYVSAPVARRCGASFCKLGQCVAGPWSFVFLSENHLNHRVANNKFDLIKAWLIDTRLCLGFACKKYSLPLGNYLFAAHVSIHNGKAPWGSL